MAKAVRVKPVERRIQFFQLSQGADGKQTPFDPAPVLSAIERLGFESDGRYLTDENGNDTCCWLDDRARGEFRLCIVRRSGFPEVERAGKLAALDIPGNAGLAEPTHFVFFKDGILGAEFNFYGPRPTRVPAYFQSKASECCQGLIMEAILRGDTDEILASLKHITMMHIHLRASDLQLIKQADEDLFSALDACRTVTGAEDLDLVFQHTPRGQGTLFAKMRTTLRKLVRDPGANATLRKLVVRGRQSQDSPIEQVDLLNDLLVTTRRIVRMNPRSRALDRDAAYAAIREAYNELRQQIQAGSRLET